MADRPILFSGPMVRALLAGTKTQTRRNLDAWTEEPVAFVEAGAITAFDENEREYRWPRTHAVGDCLYVREHWRTAGSVDGVAPRDLPRSAAIVFEADGFPAPNWRGRFRQGMHMPRWASRLTLTVTDVRVERLQAISEPDAQAEGITRIGAEYIARGSKDWDSGPNFYQVDIGGGSMNDANAVAVYMRLWDWINGEGAADANPWVAAYTFTVERGNIEQLGKAA